MPAAVAILVSTAAAAPSMLLATAVLSLPVSYDYSPVVEAELMEAEQEIGELRGGARPTTLGYDFYSYHLPPTYSYHNRNSYYNSYGDDDDDDDVYYERLSHFLDTDTYDDSASTPLANLIAESSEMTAAVDDMGKTLFRKIAGLYTQLDQLRDYLLESLPLRPRS